jgi:rhodanese-related sulfurtransferase
VALGLTLALSAPAAGIPKTIPGVKTVNAKEAKKLFDQGVIFVDLRSKRDFAAGRVPDAVHIEFHDVYSEATLGQHVKKD